MKILLTTPPQPIYSILPDRYKRFHNLFYKIGGKKPILGIQPPYGLMYLSAYLKKAGHDVFIVDGLMSSLEHIVLKIKKEQIDIAGISAVSWNWCKAKELANILRKTFPGLKIAVGGAHVNAERGNVLRECADFDYAFYGDSEHLFSEIISALSSGNKPRIVDGFAYRENDMVFASDNDASIYDIDSMLFPDRDSLGFDNYRPSPLSYRKLPFTAMFGSRGCPYRCTFCHTDKRVRVRSAGNLFKEIELLRGKYGVKEILFYDDTFTLDKKRVYEFCELLIKKDIGLSWSASVRADTVSRDVIKIMKKAGCWRVLMGIESGSQRLLTLIKKGITLEQIESAVNTINSGEMQILGMFMFGIPSETYSEGLETIKFMKKLHLDYVSVCNLTPFPGTEVYKKVANEPGFKGFSRMNMFDVAYVPETMKERELRDLLKRSMREFYFRFSYIIRQFQNIKSPIDIIRYIRGFIVILFR